jgi:excinuclease ABC subunit C
MTSLKKVEINQRAIEILEKISNNKVYIKNTSSLFGQNTYALKNLQELGQKNAMVYLQRQKLGHKLNPLEENNLFVAVVELQKFLGLKNKPRRIECYDISHMSGTSVYGSMVTFIDGQSQSRLYKLFKCPDRNDDFLNHHDVLTRRLKRGITSEFEKKTDARNNEWRFPDLIIVDGGKGQLTSDYKALVELGLQDKIEIISLAKKEEEIFFINHEEKVNQLFKENSNLKLGKEGGILLTGDILFLVQRIRDEAHRFAIKNNRNDRLKAATKSIFDDIPGIGTVTKTKILKTFGSAKNMAQTMVTNPELVRELIGEKATEIIAKFLKLEI